METRRVEVDQIAPGMRLAEPVANPAGIVLMPAGIRLTPMFILRLKKWGILHVVVEKEAQAADAEPLAPEGPKCKTGNTTSIPNEQNQFARDIAIEVSRWFMNVQENPLMMQLRSVAIRKLVAHGRSGVINLMRKDALPGEEGTA